MANFDEAIKIILKHEGGWVNNPSDPGGETNMGITKRDYPHLDIKNLTVEQAKEIYKSDYWDKVKGDKIIDQHTALQVFDMCVNSGYSRATKIAQTILNIVVDGSFGPQTLKHINNADTDLFLVNYKLERVKFYTRLASKKSLRQFLYSWIKRTIE